MNFNVDLDKKPERFRDRRPGIRLAVVNKSTEIFGKNLLYFLDKFYFNPIGNVPGIKNMSSKNYTTLISRIIAQKRAKPNLT